MGVNFSNPVVGSTFYMNEVALFKHKDDDHAAGFEVSNQEDEFYEFSNYHPTRINSSGVYSRTGSSAYLLTGSTQVSNFVIGPAKSLRVYPGDAVHLEAYGRYLTTTGNGTDVGSVIAGALQNAFGLSAGGATDVAYQSIGNLFGEGAIIGTTAYPVEDEVPPKAFLNYILFDDNYVPYDFGYDQIESTGVIPGSTSDRMSLVAKVRKPGYIYVYLSNENEVEQEVYFDDLAIKHVKGVAIQQSDYYPFGLTFNSYQRENSVEQRWKFQGQEHIDDLGLNWDSFKWRNHQPDIGRFFNIDPIADRYVHNSPYAFSENHVVAHVELEGLEKISIQGAEYKAHQKGETIVADKQIYRDNKVYNRNLAEAPNGGDFKELTAKVDASNGQISNIHTWEGGDSVMEEMFDMLTSGNLNDFTYDLTGTDTQSGSTISGNVEGANFEINIVVNGETITFNSSLSGGDPDKGYVVKTSETNKGSSFVIGSLKAGRDKGTTSSSSISIPYVMDKDGNAVFDFQKSRELRDKDENESTSETK